MLLEVPVLLVLPVLVQPVQHARPLPPAQRAPPEPPGLPGPPEPPEWPGPVTPQLGWLATCHGHANHWGKMEEKWPMLEEISGRCWNVLGMIFSDLSWGIGDITFLWPS